MIEIGTTVVNIKSGLPYDVYIGRPSIWGNPYSHLPNTIAKYKVANRQEAVLKYKEYILNRSDLLEKLPELKGKILGCWCVPKLCHGYVLVNLIEFYATSH